MNFFKLILLATILTSWIPTTSFEKKISLDYESEEIQEEEEEGEELAA
jgi:hypothetical protein